jgi:kynurenine formamidase
MDQNSNRREFLKKSFKNSVFMFLPYSRLNITQCYDYISSGHEKDYDLIVRRTPLTTEDYLKYVTKFKNWGRWGENDQHGTLNFINNEIRIDATRLVKIGETISCGRALNPWPGPDNWWPSKFYVKKDRGLKWKDGFITSAQDYIAVVSHGFVETHIDALCHVHTHDGRMYNNRPTSDIDTSGAKSNSIDVWKDGIISRAVFYDIPKLREKEYITPEQPIQGWELEDFALKYNIIPQQGDIVIINCGRDKYFKNNPNAPRVFGQKPGSDPSVLEFLYKYDSAVLGSDLDEAPFNDNYPTQIPIHAIANPYMGLPTLWNLNLNRLKVKCDELNRNDFLFIVNPLIITGGTGSIVNPIAIF